MYLTIDCECDGLYGECFAVGWVLTTKDGFRVTEGISVAEYNDCKEDRFATQDNSEWMASNVLSVLPSPDTFTTFGMRQKFFAAWQASKITADQLGEPLYIVADVAFPCETEFLRQVRHDGVEDDRGFSVYPLVDLSSMLLMAGFDPVGTFARKPDELPAHNPLRDARQTSRILHQILDGTFTGV